jgi:hypothetical protein
MNSMLYLFCSPLSYSPLYFYDLSFFPISLFLFPILSLRPPIIALNLKINISLSVTSKSRAFRSSQQSICTYPLSFLCHALSWRSCSLCSVSLLVTSQGTWKTITLSLYDSLRISSPLLTQLPQFNTSTLGQNLVSKTSSSSSASDTSLESLSRSISSDLNGVLGDVADELASELGIKQWYSWHLMDMCEGTFTPNATASGAQLNVSSCTNQTALCRSSPPLPTRSSSWK